MSRRLGRSQSSFLLRPSHGRAPLQVPSDLVSSMLASESRRVLPHSQRTTRSVRSPEVPCSSSQSGRVGGQPPEAPCTNRLQAMSSTCPRGQARTNRVATTSRPSNRCLLSSARRCTSRRERASCLLVSCTTNHSGKRDASIPVVAAFGAVDAAGGAYNRGWVTPVIAWSFLARRGSTTSSSLPGGGQVSRPATMAESCGRSISAPGP